MYRNVNGVLYNLNYGLASSVAVDPIEKKPLFPFPSGDAGIFAGRLGLQFSLPGLPELGNLDGKRCPEKNRKKFHRDGGRPGKTESLPGHRLDYNEPSMWFEYTLDTAKLAKQNNL